MRSSIVKIITISAGVALSIGSANAAIVSGTYAVTGSNFASSSGVPPFASITESFTISFDNSNFIPEQSAGITLNASTITPASTLVFSYNNYADSLIVGGMAKTAATPDPNSTDFALVISNASNVATFSITSLSYTDGSGSTYSAGTRMKATPSATVPEPTSLVLLGTAATLAFVRRRRTRTDARAIKLAC